MSFLKAEWRKLAIANYVIDSKILEKYVPAGTQLDLWENKCFISLVGFMFVNTRLLGLKIPYHTNFEEVNLRFYVKRKHKEDWRRGVVFIKEIVPKKALTLVANTIYKEHYETMPMSHEWNELDDKLLIKYSWKKQDWNHFEVMANSALKEIKLGSETEFITEHYWGYAKINDQKTNEYEVTHPKWQHYEVENATIEVDFGKVYGTDWRFLNQRKPDSVMLAEGSEITVENKRTIKF